MFKILLTIVLLCNTAYGQPIVPIAGTAVDPIGGCALNAHLAPQAMDVNSSGIYVADVGNARIRKISLDLPCLGGTLGIRTLAGSGSFVFADGPANDAGFIGPNGIAASSDGSVVYVSDAAGNQPHRIRKIANGIVSTLTTLPSNVWPAGLAIGENGDILYAAQQTGMIRRLSPNGDSDVPVVTGLSNPTDVVIGPGGVLYIAIQGNCTVGKWINGKLVTVVGVVGSCGYNGDGSLIGKTLAGPQGLSLNGYTLYIAEIFAPRVRAVDMEHGNINTIAGTGVSGITGSMGDPCNISRFKRITDVGYRDGSVFISDRDGGQVRACAQEIPLPEPTRSPLLPLPTLEPTSEPTPTVTATLVPTPRDCNPGEVPCREEGLG